MTTLDRRQALVTIGAVPDLLRGTGRANRSRRARKPAHTTPPDPEYAHGKPLQALRRPIHSLHDLMPPAPANPVALTIDDGPHPVYTPMTLDVLAEFGVPATFSLIGQQVTEYPQLVRRIVAGGHQVSDHTVTHPLNLPRLGASKIREEIGGAHDRIAQISGVAPKFFRSPGGAWSQQVIDIAAEQSMICIDWQVDPRDWARPGTRAISDQLLRPGARHPALPRRRWRSFRDHPGAADGPARAEAARPHLRRPLSRRRPGHPRAMTGADARYRQLHSAS